MTFSLSSASESSRACSAGEFGRQAGVFGGEGLTARRVGAADRGQRLADRRERRRVVGVGFADGHSFELLERGLQLIVRHLRGPLQLRELDVGFLVQRPLQATRAAQGVVAQVGDQFVQADLQPAVSEGDLALRFGELLGSRFERFERVDQAPGAAGRAPQAARQRSRARLGTVRAFGQQPGAERGFGDAVANLADPGGRAGQAATDPADVGERTGFTALAEQRLALFAERADRLRRPAPGRPRPERPAARRCVAASG